jgi:hypothetical protein
VSWLQASGPLNCSGPHPDLVLVRWCSEPDPDGTFGPCDRVGTHQFLNAVLPQDPGVHPLWDCRRAHRELAHLLRLQAPGLP